MNFIVEILFSMSKLFTVVPSDVVAGLVLLRKFQKLEREAIVRQVRKIVISILIRDQMST